MRQKHYIQKVNLQLQKAIERLHDKDKLSASEKGQFGNICSVYSGLVHSGQLVGNSFILLQAQRLVITSKKTNRYTWEVTGGSNLEHVLTTMAGLNVFQG